jgi:hypothetical protein
MTVHPSCNNQGQKIDHLDIVKTWFIYRVSGVLGTQRHKTFQY